MGVPPAAVPSSWAAIPNFLQGHPGREARLVPLVPLVGSAGPHYFSGSLLALGQQEGSDAMGLLGNLAGWTLSKCDRGRGCSRWGLEPPTSHQPSGCSWWASLHVAGEEMLQPPALLLHCH